MLTKQEVGSKMTVSWIVIDFCPCLVLNDLFNTLVTVFTKLSFGFRLSFSKPYGCFFLSFLHSGAKMVLFILLLMTNSFPTDNLCISLDTCLVEFKITHLHFK